MINFITKHKKIIDERLVSFLLGKKSELSDINQWGTDIIGSFVPFVTAGKTIRGNLLIYTYGLFKTTIPDNVISAAAALELFHSGLLVHDDIMDQDAIRRGMKSIHTQYGENIGICAGDLLFFLGYELLSSVDSKLTATASRELAAVTVGQMQDVSARGGDLLTMYRYKTARYTFSLPFMIGASLADTPSPVISKLEKLGESLGLLFQIRDDELDHAETKLASLKTELTKQANTIISELSVDSSRKSELVTLVDFCQKRET